MPRLYDGVDMVIDVLIEVLLPIAVVVAIGFFMQRRLQLDLSTLNRTAIYGLAPALIFVSLVRSDMGGDDALKMALLSAAVVLAMGVVTLLVVRPLNVNRSEASALLLAALFMNSGNYGLPAVQFAFGDAGFELGLVFFIMQSILGQTLGVGVAVAGATTASGFGLPRAILSRLLHMPQIYAVTLALAVRFSGFSLVDDPGALGAVYSGLALLAEAALPLMLLLLGMQLGSRIRIEAPRLVALAGGLRLVMSPLLAYGIALALGLDTLALGVGVLMAGMPTAVNMTILAREFNNQPALVVSSVVFSSCASLFTLTVLLSLLRV